LKVVEFAKEREEEEQRYAELQKLHHRPDHYSSGVSLPKSDDEMEANVEDDKLRKELEAYDL